VDPTGGMRVYATQVSDALGEYVLHQVATASGMEPGAPGLVRIVSQAPVVQNSVMLSGPTDTSTVQVAQQETAAISTIGNAEVLPMAIVEQIIGSLGQAGHVVQDNMLLQPGAILTSESGDQGLSDPASLGAGQADWLTQDYLAYLGQAARRSLLTPATYLLDGSSTDTLCSYVDGVEAYFAREGSNLRNLQ
jgi:hypothetical protein